MAYILPSDFIYKLRNNLIKDYEKESKTSLSYEPSSFAITTGLAKNTPLRKKQIEVIHHWMIYLAIEDDLTKKELTQLSVMFTICLYTIAEVKKGSLKKVLESYLGLDKQTVDNGTKFHTLWRTKNYLSQPQSADFIKLIPIEIWQKLSNYLDAEEQNLREINKEFFPITRALMKIATPPAALIGLSIGIVAGPIIAGSMEGVPICAYIIQGLQGTFHLLFKHKADIAVFLLAPGLAHSLLETFSAAGLGWALKEIMGYIGKFVAIPPGVVLDLSFIALKYLYNYFTQANNELSHDIEGISLIDGSFFEKKLKLNIQELGSGDEAANFFQTYQAFSPGTP